MPDDSYAERMLEDLHGATAKMEKAIEGMDRLLRGYNGTEGLLTKLSHVERTAKENRAAIDKLTNSIDMIARPVDIEMSKAKALAILAEKVGIITALGMGVANAMGWL